MYFKSIQKFLLIFGAVFYSSMSLANVSWPACTTDFNISGLPTSSVGVAANTPVSWNVTITGGNGFDADTFNIGWLSNPAFGSISANWTSRSGHVATVTLTYTPNSNFKEGNTEDLRFKVIHGYGSCTSVTRQIRLHEESCNGAFAVTAKSWSTTPISVNWGQQRNFTIDVHTWDAAVTPAYNIVPLDSLPNLGALNVTGNTALTQGRRLAFNYKHNEVSSGDDTIKFRIEDNSITDSAARASCGTVVTIPIKVQQQPANFYCGGLGATLTAVPAIINKGGTSTITVQGTNTSNGSGSYTYRVISSHNNGSIPSADMSETASTTGNKVYTYTHGGSNGGGDTISIEIKDAVRTECKITRNVTVAMVNVCASALVTSPTVAAINRGAFTNFTVNVAGGSGTYKYRVTSSVDNGTVIGENSGWQTTNSAVFGYQHDASNFVGETITVEVEDQVTECKYTVNIPIQLINYCDGFGIGSSSDLLLVINPGGSGTSTIYANQGAGSGQYIYTVSTLPTRGTVDPHSSGITMATSFDFNYHHVGSETDSFVVSVQDAVYTECIQQATVTVSFINYCETFTSVVTPLNQTITIGGSYTFSVAGGGGSGQYEYTITQLPDNGVITTPTVVNSTGVNAFGYTHDPSKVNNSDEIKVKVKDAMYLCEKEYIVKMNMVNHCGNISYSINNPGTNYVPRGLGEVVPINITIVGGSGDYTINKYNGTAPWWVDYTYGNGVLTDMGQTVNGNVFTKHFNYVSNTVGQERLYFEVIDNIYTHPNSSSHCRWGWRNTSYMFDGTEGNNACHNLNVSVSGLSTSNGGTNSNVGGVFEFTMTGLGTDPNRVYDFIITEAPGLGSLIPIGLGALPNQMKFRYTAPINNEVTEYFRIDFKDATDATCSGETRRFRINVNDLSDSCNGSNNVDVGDVIIDNTASEVAAISSNLKFMAGCNKDQTTIGYKATGSPDINGQGANVINIKDYQIVDRHADPAKLKVHVGVLHNVGQDEVVESSLLKNASTRNNYFTQGQHLFDLDHLRSTADWLVGDTGGIPNVTPRPTAGGGLKKLEPGTYGTITMQKFLENIRDGKIMYGVVRVLIGLEKGTCEPNCATGALNGLGEPTNETNIYGFCGEATTTGLCACSPSTRQGRSTDHHFPKIKPLTELCLDSNNQPIILPKDAKVMVKGSLLWDFVDYSKDVNGVYPTIPLASLPFFPRELYFMVDIPIVINSAYNEDSTTEVKKHDYCGGQNYSECDGRNISEAFVKQAEYINSLTNTLTLVDATYTHVPSPAISFSKVPKTSLTYYEYVKNEPLTATLFNALPIGDRYHLLMPSGYTEGWEDAFKHLQIKTETWEALGYSVPNDAPRTVPLTADWIRNTATQDVPAYLYSGGLVDMHSHVNVSGLVYVPQALEMEAETANNLRQMVMGALIVKDGFFIKAKGNSIAIISNFVSSYSSIKTANPIIKRRRYVGSGIERATEDSVTPVEASPVNSDCLFCQGGSGSVSSDGGASAGGGVEGPVYRKHWQQIIPN